MLEIRLETVYDIEAIRDINNINFSQPDLNLSKSSVR
jgi:hypothetical protein